MPPIGQKSSELHENWRHIQNHENGGSEDQVSEANPEILAI
jgi:hypothetical protein